MKGEFEMSMMGELKFFLGLQIMQLDHGIFIHQEKYIKNILKKFKMDEAKLMSIPMHPSNIICVELEGKSISENKYRGMLRSLLYLTASIPNIMFSVGLCVRFQSSPKESNITTIKKWSNFNIKGYNDTDFTIDKVERKSTSGTYQFLKNSLVSWGSRKQATIDLSTSKVEYVVVATR
uniref:Reverse transcriptase Ty1/copia-type domain-containing protein n=1 Tax=Cajanus cajan TaxID=3821 RepID=A0A151TBB3_CAJCA|nr:hypothetical protein KK1_018931 [Cajanus cajan]